MQNKRINIFIGHFGSGKTEVALSFLMNRFTDLSKTAIVDLDIVNPFFRASDAHEVLKKLNIRLIKPIYSNTNIDVPALPPDINSVLEDENINVAFDVGGDDLGARAISCYKNSIDKQDYELFFVVNTNRPLTSNKEKIKAMLQEIEATTRLKVTKLVNNTNLLSETKVHDILEGSKLVKDIANEHKINFAFTCATKNLKEELEQKSQDSILILDNLITLPWKKG